LHDFTQNPPSNALADYFNKLAVLTPPERKKRILRAFVHENLKSIFSHFGFSTEFLPTIHYTGNNNFKLLHFTAIGTKLPPSAGGAIVFQRVENLIRQRFLGLVDESFRNLSSDIEETNVNSVNPVTIFRNSSTFKRLWQ